MKNVYSIIIALFLVVMTTATLSSQTFYRSVADVDSFAYVTMNDKILVLKRDQANDLQYVNIVPFLNNHRTDGYNSSIIINDYLIVASADSVVLYSILDRQNPVELSRIFVSNLYMIDKFGDYLFVYKGQITKLYKIETDSLVLKTEFSGPSVFQGYTYNFYALITHSYPYIYSKAIDPEGILIRKYLEDSNQIDTVNFFIAPFGWDLDGMAANSQHLFTREGTSSGSGLSTSYYKYIIFEDSLINKTLQCPYHYGAPTNSDGWMINNTYGINGPTMGIYDVTGSPCSLYTKNINFNFPSHYFLIKNSIYKIGDNSLYYLHQLNGMNMTFKEFKLFNLLEPEINSRHQSTDALFKWSPITPIVSYHLQITDNGTFNSTVTDTTILDNIYIASGLPEGKTIYWRVAINFEFGSIEFSNISYFVTRLYNPDSVQSIKISDNSIRLSWIDKSNRETSYYIMKGEQGGALNDFVTLGANANTYIDTNIVSGTEYIYGVYCRASIYRSDTVLTTNVTDLENEEKNSFLSFSLSQNYPNPFNPSTKISWQSPLGSHQTLKVYDVLGREVATLVDEYRDAGMHEIEFQSEVGNRQLTSGVYYYQLKVGAFIETKKMMVIK